MMLSFIIKKMFNCTFLVNLFYHVAKLLYSLKEKLNDLIPLVSHLLQFRFEPIYLITKSVVTSF